MSDLLAAVNQHNEAVRRLSEDRVRYRTHCAFCNGSQFASHELRRRSLRIIVGSCVHVLTLWLGRWRCLECRRIGTDYPPFRLAA